MIKSIRHKGLRQFFEKGSKAGIIPLHAERLELQLAILDAADVLEDVNRPGYNLYSLTGDQAGRMAITVQANWRLTFEFTNGDVEVLDYEDYH